MMKDRDFHFGLRARILDNGFMNLTRKQARNRQKEGEKEGGREEEWSRILH